MSLNRSIYHDMIGEAAYQNQIAVDIFKSNRAPDMKIIQENNRHLHRIPNHIRDKKKSGIYSYRPIEVEGYSPVELMVRQANSFFSQSALIARQSEQFYDLFPESYTPSQYNQALLAKAEFDALFNHASIYNQKLKNEVGPVLNVTTQSGKELEITNLNKFGHPRAFNSSNLDIRCCENKSPNAHYQLIAYAPTGEINERGQPVYQKLGTVCEISRKELGLKADMDTKDAAVQLTAPMSEKQVKLMFKQAYEYAEAFRESIEEQQRASMAAAAWHIATAPQGGKIDNKVSNFVFAAFAEEIIGQLGQLQFTEFLAGGLKEHNQVPDELWCNGDKVKLEVREGDSEKRRRGERERRGERDGEREREMGGRGEPETGRLPINSVSESPSPLVPQSPSPPVP